MAKRQFRNIKRHIERRQEQQQHQRTGKDYVPGIITQDFSSKGRDHRKKGILHDRILHALSDLESNFLDVIQWITCVTDIREQFLLDLDETQAIAREIAVKHPHVKGQNIYLTTDMVVTIQK